MPSTPLISCSIGAATVSAIVSAEAPGKAAVTATEGGAISGYCGERQRRIGEGAEQGDEQGDHRREDRPVDEEARHVHRDRWTGVATEAGAGCGAAPAGGSLPAGAGIRLNAALPSGPAECAEGR